MNEEKIKVLYISGWTRSGSTLLGTLISQFKSFHFAGELIYIWERGYLENRLCSCGKAFSDCEYWNDVRRTLESSGLEINPLSLNRDTYMFTRTRNIFRVFGSWLQNKSYLENTEYKEIICELYKSISKKKKFDFLVDTSKFPIYGYLLSQISYLDVITIHLVRDPRGCAFSWKTPKRDLDPNSEGFIPPINIIKSSMKWVTMNVASFFMNIINPSKYILVKYEDLVENPMKTMKRVFHKIGMEPEFLPLEKNSILLNKQQHIFAGNPDRYIKGKIKLYLDSRWVTGLSSLEKLIIYLITFPVNIIFGYKFFR